MQDKAVQFGILGAGRIAANAFVPALNATDKAELAAVASRDADRAAALKPPRVYQRYEDLLQDPQVEAVYIATHNGLHHPLTMQALEHGKHVLCEKPLACSPAQCREMIDAARDRQRLLVEGFMYRYHPQIAEAQRRLNDIGELKIIEAAFSYHLDREDDVRWNPEWGGGGLFDIGCYCVDICRLFFQAEPQRATAVGAFHPRHDVDVSLHGLLDFGQDRFGVISCGFDAGLRRRALFCGTQGTITLPNAFFRQLEPVQLILNESLWPQTVTIPPADVFKLEIEDFANAVCGHGTPRRNGEEAYHNACAIDALLRSARQHGAPQTVTP